MVLLYVWLQPKVRPMTNKTDANANLLAEKELAFRLNAKKLLIARLKSQPVMGQINWTRDELYPAEPNANPACSRSGWK
jgi:hypothetical protein